MTAGFTYLSAELEADLLIRRKEWFALANHLISLLEDKFSRQKCFAHFETSSERVFVQATVGLATIAMNGDYVEFHNRLGPQIDEIIEGPERLTISFPMRGWQTDERKCRNIEDYFGQFIAQFNIDSSNMLLAKVAEMKLEDTLGNYESDEEQ